jgi:hypothetical protein
MSTEQETTTETLIFRKQIESVAKLTTTLDVTERLSPKDRNKLWSLIQPKLKDAFRAANLVTCEICHGSAFLGLAHRLKRRYITTCDELSTVGNLCVLCHEKLEYGQKERMFRVITELREKNEVDNSHIVDFCRERLRQWADGDSAAGISDEFGEGFPGGTNFKRTRRRSKNGKRGLAKGFGRKTAEATAKDNLIQVQNERYKMQLDLTNSLTEQNKALAAIKCDESKVSFLFIVKISKKRCR